MYNIFNQNFQTEDDLRSFLEGCVKKEMDGSEYGYGYSNKVYNYMTSRVDGYATKARKMRKAELIDFIVEWATENCKALDIWDPNVTKEQAFNELVKLTRDWNEGCESGKERFLKGVGLIPPPKPRVIELTVKVNVTSEEVDANSILLDIETSDQDDLLRAISRVEDLEVVIEKNEAIGD